MNITPNTTNIPTTANGLTAIRLIRARPDEKAKVPIIVITADVTPDLDERCAAVGADAVLIKPMKMDRLLKTVLEVLTPQSRRRAKDGTGERPVAG